jgi:hypothetical protein
MAPVFGQTICVQPSKRCWPPTTCSWLATNEHVMCAKLNAKRLRHVQLAGNKRACDVCQIKLQKTKTSSGVFHRSINISTHTYFVIAPTNETKKQKQNPNTFLTSRKLVSHATLYIVYNVDQSQVQ